MRFYLLFPLAFLSGIHGFALFTPYLMLVLVVGKIVARRRRRNAVVERQVANETLDAACG